MTLPAPLRRTLAEAVCAAGALTFIAIAVYLGVQGVRAWLAVR